MSSSLRPFAALALTASLAACAAQGTPRASSPIPVAPAVHIDIPDVAPMAGASLKLTARVTRAAGDTSTSGVHWSVVRGQQAWVAPNGVLTLLEPGKVTVRARLGTLVADRVVTIEPNAAARVVMAARVVPRTQAGDTVRIGAFVYDADQQRLMNAPVAFALV